MKLLGLYYGVSKMEQFKGRLSKVFPAMYVVRFPAISLVLLLTLSSAVLPLLMVAQVSASPDERPSLGLRLKEELKSIIEEHKELINETILEFRVRLHTLLEDKTKLIMDFVEERLSRVQEIMQRIEELRESYAAGNISRVEFLAGLADLRAQLKAAVKMSEKLGHLIQEMRSGLRDVVKEKVERLRELGREFGENVSEAARSLAEEFRESRRVYGEEGNSTASQASEDGWRGPSENRSGGGIPPNMDGSQTFPEGGDGRHGQGHRQDNIAGEGCGNGRGDSQHPPETTPRDQNHVAEDGRGRQNGRGSRNS
ncbi:hypothetical protein HRbin01_00318 [archaeon HR01]|nr:hypothetical protein HRbin01_00318 [archaeon HR01]